MMSGDNKFLVIVPLVLAFGMVSLSLSIWLSGASPPMTALSWRRTLGGCCPNQSWWCWGWRRRRRKQDRLCRSCAVHLSSGGGNEFGKCGSIEDPDTASLSSSKNFVLKESRAKCCECPCHSCGKVSVIAGVEFGGATNVCFDGGFLREVSGGGERSAGVHFTGGAKQVGLEYLQKIRFVHIFIYSWIDENQFCGNYELMNKKNS